MVRFDATTLVAVLSPVDQPEVEAVFHRMLELDCDVALRLAAGEAVASEALEVDLRFDPSRPCSLPVLHWGAPDASPDLAVVLEHRDGSLRIDLDGDGRSDAVLEVGHGSDAYTVGSAVILRRRGDGDLRLVGPAAPPSRPTGRPIVVQGRSDGTAEDPDDGHVGPVHEVPSLRDLERRPGEGFLAYRCSDGSFQALSTALPHLQDEPGT